MYVLVPYHASLFILFILSGGNFLILIMLFILFTVFYFGFMGYSKDMMQSGAGSVGL